MSLYDEILKWRKRVCMLASSARLRMAFCKNVHITGLNTIHHTVKIYGRAGGMIALGDRVFAERQCVIVAVGGRLTVGAHTYFNSNCTVVCHERMKIGSGCMFGPNVCVYDHDHQYGYDGISSDYRTSPVMIGDDCWIGANVIILRGTQIGDHCVIGAGVVVKGDIPAHSVVTGNRELVIKPITDRG